MKNDLDFIKDKIDNSGVKAPDDMDEAYFAKALENVYPKPVPVSKKPERRRRSLPFAAAAVAAALVVAITLGIVLSARPERAPQLTEELPGGLTLRRFQSYEEVDRELERLKSLNSRKPRADYEYYAYDEEGAVSERDAAVAEDAAGSYASASHSETYKQVEGVDEADIIKTDGRYIYCVDERNSYKNACNIIVFSAEGKDSARVAEIGPDSDPDSASDDGSVPWGYGSRYISEMYIRDERLIAICSDYDGSYRTRVMVYDISDINSVGLIDSYVQSGSYEKSRMIGDKLYLVSTHYPDGEYTVPVCGRGDDAERVPADCIYALADNETESFLVVSEYDTLDHTAQTVTKTILGGVDDLYCNENHMYIYTGVWNYAESSRLWGSYDDYNTGDAATRILKVDLTDGIAFTAYAEIDGRIDDQYALDEYEGNLRVAVTSTSDGADVNDLYVLDADLNVIGSVTGFARNESIKAVRYLGDTAYVITYEQTDPLFIIDLSAPQAPAILGEVKISGFSTMLVPVDENTLLGLGYHTENEDYTTMEVQEGFKLALFDISDKSAPKVLDSKSYVDCFSAVQNDPKALVYNPVRGDYVIPLNYSHWEYSESDYYEGSVNYGGVLNFSVSSGRIIEKDRYKADCSMTERCVYVGDTVYMTYYDDYGELCIDSVPYPDK